MTKVIAFNGSPRKKGNTSILIGYIFEVLEGEGIETELIQVGGKKVRGCTACMKCFENKDGHCVFDDDIINHCIDRIVEADGIILGSPVYFLDVTTEMKGLIDRAGFVSMANGGLYQRKAGMAVAAVRRSGEVVPLIPCSISCLPPEWLFRHSRFLASEERSGMFTKTKKVSAVPEMQGRT